MLIVVTLSSGTLILILSIKTFSNPKIKLYVNVFVGQPELKIPVITEVSGTYAVCRIY